MKSKNENIRFLLGTAANAPKYEFVIDYPDADGVMRKANEYGDPLPYETEKPKGGLLIEVVDEETKDLLVELRRKLQSGSQ